MTKINKIFDLIKAIIVTLLFLYTSVYQWLGLIEWLTK